MERSLIYRIKIFSLCLLAFSLGFEYWDPFGVRSIFTVTKFAGFLYAFLSLFDLKNNLKISIHNRVFIYSAFSLWLWLTFISLVNVGINGGNLSFLFGILQVILLYWLVFNDVLYNPKIRQLVFLFLILGMLLISILLSLGIGIENLRGDQIDDIDSTRVYFMGMNPNRMGDLAAIAILLIFSLVFSRKNNKIWFLLLLIIPSLLSVIGFSGSRGSFIVIFLGLCFFFLLRKSTIRQKMVFLVIGSVSSIFIFGFLENFEMLQGRLTNTYEGGDIGGRFDIWKSVLNIIQENPVFGTGTEGYKLKMLQEYGEQKDPHNLFLYVWVVGGMIALLLLLIFYIRTLKNALLNLKINRDSTNVMIFIAALFLVSKTGGVIESKLIWLMLACIAPIISTSDSTIQNKTDK